METINVHQAKTPLSRLLYRVYAGEELMREIYRPAISSAWRSRRTVRSKRAKLKKFFGPFPLRRWFSLISLIPQEMRAVLRYGIADVR